MPYMRWSKSSGSRIFLPKKIFLLLKGAWPTALFEADLSHWDVNDREDDYSVLVFCASRKACASSNASSCANTSRWPLFPDHDRKAQSLLVHFDTGSSNPRTVNVVSRKENSHNYRKIYWQHTYSLVNLFTVEIIPDADHLFVNSKGEKQFNNILKTIIYPWFKRTSN